MMTSIGLGFFCIISVIMTSSTFADDPISLEPVVLLKNIVQARNLIHSGHVVVDSQAEINGKKSVPIHWEILFDGTKTRVNQINNSSVVTVCLDCYANYTRLYYTTEKDITSQFENALVFYDGYDAPGLRLSIPDPKWAGYLPYSFLGSVHTNPLLVYSYDYQKNGYEFQMVADTLGGHVCWKISFPLHLNSGDSQLTIWADQKNSDRVYRVDCHLPQEKSGDGIDYLDRIDTKGEVIEKNIWFPIQTHFSRTENGKVTRSSIAKFQILSLNQPLPVDTFSPKSIVKPDTPVAWHLDRDRPFPEAELIWDGEKIVPIDYVSKMMQEAPRIGTFNIISIILGLVLISFGIGLKLYKKYQ
ncbi:MAG: hypothetical protein LBQ50_14375 [Planctomycetaceae bacterium]|nr:hypothetical protein [Planctomycetaceae bacterium]